MTIALYIRVSSPKGQRTDSQRAELEAWQRQRIKSARWFEDRESATIRRDASRNYSPRSSPPRLIPLWCGSSTVWPEASEGINVLADWCQHGVRIIAITQQIDLSGPVGNLIASLLFGIAEIELQHSEERQAIGIALAKKRGVYTGRRQGQQRLRRRGLEP